MKHVIFLITFLLLLSCNKNISDETNTRVECDGSRNGYYYIQNDLSNDINVEVYVSHLNDPLKITINKNSEKLIHSEWGMGPCEPINLYPIIPSEHIDKIIIKNTNDDIIYEQNPINDNLWIYNFDNIEEKNIYKLIYNF